VEVKYEPQICCEGKEMVLRNAISPTKRMRTTRNNEMKGSTNSSPALLATNRTNRRNVNDVGLAVSRRGEYDHNGYHVHSMGSEEVQSTDDEDGNVQKWRWKCKSGWKSYGIMTHELCNYGCLFIHLTIWLL